MDTVLFAIALAVAPPLAAVAYSWLVGRVSRWAGDVLYLVALAAFLVPFAFQLARTLDPSKRQALLVVLAFCAIATAAYVRWRAVRLFLCLSVILPIGALAWFVYGIPTTIDQAQAAPVQIASRTPVVLVVLDELPVTSLMSRDGRIDALRYPNFGQLARDATWYPNATSVHPFTSRAVPAILTGRIVRNDSLPTLRDHPENLFTLIGGSYSLFAQEGTTRLCPCESLSETQRVAPEQRQCAVRRRSSSIHSQGRSRLHHGRRRRGDPCRRHVRQSVGLRRSGVPEVHRRYPARSADGEPLLHARPATPLSLAFSSLRSRVQRPPSGPTGRSWTLGDRSVVRAEGPSTASRSGPIHRCTCRPAHPQTPPGRFYDRALVVVAADHGRAFDRVPRSRRDCRALRRSRERSAVREVSRTKTWRDRLRPARTVDILPTISDVLGVRTPWRVEGSSLIGPSVERNEAVMLREDGEWVRACSEI